MEREHSQGGNGGKNLGRWLRSDEKKPIAHARYGLDPFGPIGTGAECLAESCNLDSEVAVLNDEPRPAAVHEVGLGDRCAGGVDQGFKQRSSPDAQSDWLSVAKQKLCIPVQDKGTEFEVGQHLKRIARLKRHVMTLTTPPSIVGEVERRCWARTNTCLVVPASPAAAQRTDTNR